MPNLTLLIKPASGLCNMRCKYCFYEDETQNRSTKSYGIMSDSTAKQLIAQAFCYAGPRGSVQFIFQGGEPTLAGIGFFRKFTQEVERQNQHKIPVSFGIQTNGYQLDQSFLELFQKHRFLVGISVDGIQALHDQNRLDAAGRSTYQTVVQTARNLQAAGVDVNLLCVVTRSCARNPQKVYRAMKDLGFRYFQFIPCLDPLEEGRGTMKYSLTPEAYGKFLCGLFDVWYADWTAGKYVSVRLFEDYVYNLMGLPCGTCASSGACGQYLVVESDGSAYPCDFYCLDQWRLGKLGEMSIAELLHCEREMAFLAEPRNEDCKQCQWYAACRGGCKRDFHTLQGKSHNYYCPAFQRFFAYAWPRLRNVAQQERAARRGSRNNTVYLNE